MSFSENLVQIRKKRHMSQSQLSNKSGISQQAISKLESGKSSPSEFTMQQIAKALHVPLSTLLDAPENEKPGVNDAGLADDIISRIHDLTDPELSQVSAFLDGLEAGQGIAAAAKAVPDPDASPAG